VVLDVALTAWKSVIDLVPSFFGIRTTLAEFKMSRLPVRNE
jgi:hypothetical protein